MQMPCVSSEPTTRVSATIAKYKVLQVKSATIAKCFWSALHLLLVQILLAIHFSVDQFLFGQFSRAEFKGQRKNGCGENNKKALQETIAVEDDLGLLYHRKPVSIVASHRLKLCIHFLSDQPSAPCKEFLERKILNYFEYIERLSREGGNSK